MARGFAGVEWGGGDDSRQMLFVESSMAKNVRRWQSFEIANIPKNRHLQTFSVIVE